MPISHTVKPGETLLSITFHYGFRAWQTIAKAPENAELVASRGSPHDLRPGDVLSIPDPGIGEAKLTTGVTHTLRVEAPATLLVVRVFTEFRRLKEDLDPTAVALGRKSDTLLGWKRGGKMPPLPVQRATIVLTKQGGASDGNFLRSARTNTHGRVWVESLTDGKWELTLEPDPEELSPGPAMPTLLWDHGLDWGEGVDDGTRKRANRVMKKDERLKIAPWEVEYRPLKLELEVVGEEIVEVKILTPAAPGRPDHAMVFWRDVDPDEKDQGHKKKSKGPLVSQVLEIDLKPDFMRRLFDEADKKIQPWVIESRVRPWTDNRRKTPLIGGSDAESRIRLFQVHHTAGDLIGGALNTFFSPKEQTKEGTQPNKTGIHFVNDRDGHVVRLVDDHYFTRHGGGGGRLESAWADRTNINHQALGVENVEKNLGFTDAQITSIGSLIRTAITLYNIPVKNVIGHGDVYIGKAKTCPGIHFPWPTLEASGLAVFPIPLTNVQNGDMFGGYFGDAQDSRVLREGDRDQLDANGTWSVLRGQKVVASELKEGPIETLHRYLHAIGYVPNRIQSVNKKKKKWWAVTPWENFRASNAVHTFGEATTATLGLFRGHYTSSGRLASMRNDIVDRDIAEIIYGCLLFVEGAS